MRARLTGFAAGLALVLAPAASAQSPTPTPTPSPTATPTPTVTATPTPTPTPTPKQQQDAKDRKRKDVRRIYRDFERDGRIDDCNYTLKALKIARRSIAPSFADQYPDFRDALTAAIQRHKAGKCVQQQPPAASPTPAPTPAPSSGSTTPPAPAPAPAPTPAPVPSPQSGTLPNFGAGTGGSSTPPPVTASPTPTPPGESAIPAGTPAPTPTATPAALPPKLVVTRAATDTNLFVPGTMLAIALLGLLFAGLSALFARRSGRFPALDQAWREAGFRASGTWSDFADWLRRR